MQKAGRLVEARRGAILAVVIMLGYGCVAGTGSGGGGFVSQPRTGGDAANDDATGSTDDAGGSSGGGSVSDASGGGGSSSGGSGGDASSSGASSSGASSSGASSSGAASDDASSGDAIEPTTECKSDKECSHLDKVCDDQLGYCVDCVGDDDCGKGLACKNSKCVTPPKTCKTSKECAAAGKVCDKVLGKCVECIKAADCAAGKFCKEGACTPQVCVPNSVKCSDVHTRSTCKDDGSGHVPLACQSKEVCVDGACKPSKCKPLSKLCQGHDVYVCNAKGLGMSLFEDCDKQGLTCKEAACVKKKICYAGSTKCDDQSATTVLKCNATGTDWQTHATCKSGESCKEEFGMADCTKHICKPGSGSCSADSKVQTCAANGLGFENPTACKSDQKCVMGKCETLADAESLLGVGGAFACVLVGTAGEPWCWGSNAYGQLGQPLSKKDSFKPLAVKGAGKGHNIYLGWTNACLLDVKGTLTCWGANHYGQMGNGKSKPSYSGVASEPPTVMPVKNVVDFALDNTTMFALDHNGKVWAWGSDQCGSAGAEQGKIGGCGKWKSEKHAYEIAVVKKPSVVKLPGPALRVGAGLNHACALIGTDVYCWGDARYGAVGNGKDASDYPWSNGNEYEPKPAKVKSLGPVVDLQLGGVASCATTAQGDVYCWGGNQHGELGNGGKQTSIKQPVKVAHLSTYKRLDLGNTSCGVDKAGAVRCWGYNIGGAVGNGNKTSPQVTPNTVKLSGDASFVAASINFACARIAGKSGSAEVWCWGIGKWGNLGNLFKMDSLKPVKVAL